MKLLFRDIWPNLPINYIFGWSIRKLIRQHTVQIRAFVFRLIIDSPVKVSIPVRAVIIRIRPVLIKVSSPCVDVVHVNDMLLKLFHVLLDLSRFLHLVVQLHNDRVILKLWEYRHVRVMVLNEICPLLDAHEPCIAFCYFLEIYGGIHLHVEWRLFVDVSCV